MGRWRVERMIERVTGGIRYLTYDLFEPFLNVTNVITTRVGGTSAAPYESLNLGLHVGDDPDAVLENRALVAQALGFEPDALTAASQVHGASTSLVRSRDRGRGAVDADDAIPGTDALVTNEPDLPLAIQVADCVVVSLYDPRKNAMGVVHAGWKGTLARIAEATIQRMSEEFGSDPADIVAGLSPAIGPCHYEVGQDVADSYRSAFGEDAARVIVAAPDGRCRLDLWEANALQLVRSGVSDTRMTSARVCTACSPELFYSYRRDGGRTGRFAGIMVLHYTGRRVY
jgi:YfiH family protein